MNTFLKNSLVIYTILIIGNSTSLTQKYFVIAITLLLLGYFFLKKMFFSHTIIRLFLAWGLINILALIINGGSNIPYFRIISFGIVYFLYPYLVLKLIGIEFWVLFEKWIYFFTKISIPLFAINFLDPGFFNSLHSVFSIFTNSTYVYPYWSSLLYVNAIEMDGYIRNSGFMWEPGAFSMMIVFAIIYYWLVNGVKYNKRFFIYLIALITTFSTAGYIAFAILIIGSTMKKFSLTSVLILSTFIFFFGNEIYKQDFLKGKLDLYVETFKENELKYSEHYELYKVNRLQGAYFSVIETIDYPLGYGVIAKKDYSNEIEIYGTNGLGSMLKMWGVILFFYFMYLLRKILRVFDRCKTNRVLLFFMYTSLLVIFFSNPISRNIFIYLIILTPLLFKKEFTSLVNHK